MVGLFSLRRCLLWGRLFSFFLFGRSLYNRPRPYQSWEIQPLIKKDSLGKSFPSRHVFSATVIAMLALTLNPWLGGAMLFLAGRSSSLRVLGGVHYPSDVLAGYVIGILVGLLLYL